MALRIILTIVVIVAAYACGALISYETGILTSDLASRQFENNQAGYANTQFYFRLLSALSIAVWVIAAGLGLGIWRKQLKDILGKLIVAGLCFAVIGAVGDRRAYAYYDQNNFTEAYFILPNESAFFIPDVGANKDAQSQFGSEAYLKENKVPAKRFEVPHQKLSGSSYWSNYYVPTGRLIIVDRTPYNREWVKSSSRGTSTRDEAFPCQSKEGLNVTVEISIAASVTEENAAKFLYWFGVKPPQGDRSRPEVIFASVFYGRSLSEVMDTVGRGKVQALVCQEISARALDKVNEEASLIIRSVEKGASEFLGSRGITLDYIGWAGTFSFDKDVQQAINDRYTAEKIAPALQTLQTKALIEAIAKWDGHVPQMPSVVVVPNDLLSSATNWLKKSEQQEGQ